MLLLGRWREKTMIRQLISQWGIMSIDMEKQKHYEIEQKDNTEYVENETVDNFFEEKPEEVKPDEVIPPVKEGKPSKKDKDKAVDINEVPEELTEEEENEIFGQDSFFEED